MKLHTANSGFALDVTKGNFGIDEDNLPPEACLQWRPNALSISVE